MNIIYGCSADHKPCVHVSYLILYSPFPPATPGASGAPAGCGQRALQGTRPSRWNSSSDVKLGRRDAGGRWSLRGEGEAHTALGFSGRGRLQAVAWAPQRPHPTDPANSVNFMEI